MSLLVSRRSVFTDQSNAEPAEQLEPKAENEIEEVGMLLDELSSAY